jgi:hypothetical protein
MKEEEEGRFTHKLSPLRLKSLEKNWGLCREKQKLWCSKGEGSNLKGKIKSWSNANAKMMLVVLL